MSCWRRWGWSMSSKRAVRRKMCRGKVRHETEGGAFAHMMVIIKAGKANGSLNMYRCSFCGGWHVGHTPAAVRKAITARKAMAREEQG